MDEYQEILERESEMDDFGRRLACALPPNAVVALVGTLGAGKTRLVRALAAAEGIDPRDVQSPTFVLCHQYHGRQTLYHLDAYRLKDLDEFLELGVEEMWQGGGWTLVEWADRVREALPAERLEVELEMIGPESRAVRMRALGDRYQRVLDRIAASRMGE